MKEKEETKEKKVKEKKVKEKKPKIVENKGMTGLGTDYTVYIMSFIQKLCAIIVGFAVGFAAGYLYFDNKIIGIIVGAFCGVKAISIYRNKLLKKRSNDLRLQFRDMLESLSNSYTVGMTANRAFHTAYNDMCLEHGKDSYIAKEIYLICSMHDNQGIEIKDMLDDFAKRSGIDDIKSFSSVFTVSSNLAGNIAQVVRDTRDMIGEKIEVEMEIQTMVTGQKSQLNILAIMPILMSVLTKSFNTSGGSSFLVILVKMAALIMFVFAYWLGTKIVDIKV